MTDHHIVSSYEDIDRARKPSDRDKQRVATIFTEQAWEHVLWIPTWLIEDTDDPITTVEASENIAVGRLKDYSKKSWKFTQGHTCEGYPPDIYLPKSQTVVFERARGVEAIETPQQGLEAFTHD